MASPTSVLLTSSKCLELRWNEGGKPNGHYDCCWAKAMKGFELIDCTVAPTSLYSLPESLHRTPFNNQMWYQGSLAAFSRGQVLRGQSLYFDKMTMVQWVLFLCP